MRGWGLRRGGGEGDHGNRAKRVERVERPSRVRAGKMVILIDDEDRENEGDLVIAAEKVTPEAINFMAKHGRGLICLALTEEQRPTSSSLPLMVPRTTRPVRDRVHGVDRGAPGLTTGISAPTAPTPSSPRSPDDAPTTWPARPRLPAARPQGRRAQSRRPDRGLGRPRRLAGLKPAGVICEIMNDDGTMARVPTSSEFARSTA